MQVPALSLSPSFGAVSRAGFAASDAIGVWATADGRQNDALSNQKFVAAADGVTFTANPSAYYPNERDAVRLYAYFPYQAGASTPHAVAFSVQTDQSSPADLKLSDLCWGTTQTTPSEAPVPLTFQHLLTKISVSMSGLPNGTTVSKVVWPSVVSNGTLDVETGVFTVGTAVQTLQTTGAELIAPAQSIRRLRIELSDGSRYTYEPPSAPVLTAGAAHTVHLALNPATGAAELAAPIQTTEWTTSLGSGSAVSAVRNTFTVYWQLPHPDHAQTTRAVLRVKTTTDGAAMELDALDVKVSSASNSTMAEVSFRIDEGSQLSYPFLLEELDFLRADGSLVQQCTSLVGQGIYRSGPITLGIRQTNILSVVGGAIASWDEVIQIGGVDNIKYEGNTFTVRVIEPDFDYTAVRKVRLSIWGGAAEWSVAAPTAMGSVNNFVVETAPFAFPSANGYTPPTRHYPIEWVELADASGRYLYRGYCGFEVSEGGPITLLLYPKGTVHSPSSITRPIEQKITGALGNMPFVGNTFTVRFVSPDFLDSSRPKPHTIRIGVLGDVYEWRGITMDPSSNFFTAWTTVAFPTVEGYRPTSQYYTILWVEVLSAAGTYLYKSYCNVDVTRSGAVTLDLHQRGVVQSPTTVAAPSPDAGEANPTQGIKHVANAFDIRIPEPPFDYWATSSVALSCSDGKTYTWNTGVYWSTNTNYARLTPAWPDRTGARPAAYPFAVQKIEFFNGSTSQYAKTGLNAEVSAYGTVLLTVIK